MQINRIDGSVAYAWDSQPHIYAQKSVTLCEDDDRQEKQWSSNVDIVVVSVIVKQTNTVEQSGLEKHRSASLRNHILDFMMLNGVALDQSIQTAGLEVEERNKAGTEVQWIGLTF